MNLPEMTAHELHAELAGGRVSAREVAIAVLDRAEEGEETLHAYLTLRPREAVLADATAVDAARARGEALGPLAGIPVAWKDNLNTAGLPTTCGSRMLEGYVAPYDATAVARLLAAGAVPVGKTNLDEFAMGSSTENSAFGATRNPWDPARVPGGSSGGSAAAVAAGAAVLALGSDTGGSIRQPAAFCGIVGCKPTYGRVSRYGLVAFASSFDQIGPFARDVTDAALCLGAIAGHDPLDATSAAEPAPEFTGALVPDVRGLRLGVPRELLLVEGVDPDVRRAVVAALDLLVELGASVEECSLPSCAHALDTYYILAPAEASSNLARFDGVRYGHRAGAAAGVSGPASAGAVPASAPASAATAAANGAPTPGHAAVAPGSGSHVDVVARSRAEGFGPEVRRRIMLGTYALSAGYYDEYYGRAQQVRTLVRRDFAAAFERFDALLSPTAPTVAFPLGSRVADPLAMYASDICTIPANLAGVPALSLPCGFVAGLPVGLQVMAPAFAEGLCLRVAFAFEQATDYHRRRPPQP